MARQFLYGRNPVIAALTAKRRTMDRLMIAEPFEDKQDIVNLAKNLVKIEHVSREKVSRYALNKPHQGVILQAGELPTTVQVSADSPALPEAKVMLCLDQVTDPQNYGAILRSSLFLGVSTVFASRKHTCPVTPAVSKVSSGAVEYMDIREVPHMPVFLQTCREKFGYQIVATGPGESLETFKRRGNSGKIMLVMGAEGEGIRPSVLAQCDCSVFVQGGHASIDSLNVSCATSILLYSLLH